ncbi:MAG: hypothetical protein WCI20_14915 [bacterium]
MTSRGRKGVVILTALVLALSAAVIQARVFVSGGGVRGDLSNPASFGASLYKAIMQINGGRAEVNVVACDGGLASVRAAFAGLSQTGARYCPGESLGFGMASLAGNAIRLVTLSPDPESPVLMVVVSQSDTEARVTKAEAIKHQIEDVPTPPGARILSATKNADTRTTLERVSSRMTRESVSRYYEGAMAQKGWSRMFRSAARPGLSVYVKGADICCVRIGDADSSGESSVTLLHKAGAVE